MNPEKSKLKKLKEEYSKIQKKYGLPDFDKLNEDFKIEKAAQTETELLVREIRETIGETIENFLRFIEAILKKNKKEVQAWLSKNNINPLQRAETLNVQDWINLTKSL